MASAELTPARSPREGAKVVVNDLGGSRDGSGGSAGPAQAVVDEIRAAGGEAVANTENIATWEGGKKLIEPGPRRRSATCMSW